MIRAFATSFIVPVAVLATSLAIAEPDHTPRAPQQAPESVSERAPTVLVVDASNSMWGRVDGRPKIEIAREAVGEMLSGWDASVPLGLMAYGHRRKDDCSDIEMVVPPGRHDRAAFSNALDALSPRGQTPLSAALRAAADGMGSSEGPATVILVSDGRESCGEDPCASAKMLRKTGVAFTAHAIGFSLDDPDAEAQLQCLARATGGRYVEAGSVDALNRALDEVGGKATDARLSLTALEGDGGPVIDAAIDWRIGRVVDGSVADARKPTDARPSMSLAPGTYRVEVSREGKRLERTVKLEAGQTRVMSIAFPVPEAEIQVADRVGVGAPFRASWVGPGNEGDYVTWVESGAPEGDYNQYVMLETAEGQTRLRAPDRSGDFEVRYVSQTGQTLAAATVSVEAVTASLSVPEEVVAGESFTVEWSGPAHPDDYLTILPPDAEAGDWGDYVYVEGSGGSVAMRAPTKPGQWQVRYLSGQANATFAQADFTVTTATATVEAPDKVPAGSMVEIDWNGPAAEGDYITIVSPDAAAGTWDEWAYVEPDGGPVSLRAPEKVGAWEARYLSGADNATFATDRFQVVPVSASLSAAATVAPGEEIAIEWSGPAHRGDYVTIVAEEAPEGAYGEWQEVSREESVVHLPAPTAPGDYEIRYLSGAGDRSLASTPITVSADE